MIAQRLEREFVPQEDEAEYKDLLDIVRSESGRLNGIIEEFLSFARPPRLNREQVALDQLLDETISLIEAQAAGKSIQVVREYSELGSWFLDMEQMKQALLNLLLNGIEAMPEGGILSVKGRKDEKILYLEISDTGKGIPQEEIPRIFDLYFTTKDTGTGLGLSIVQRIIMEHEGRVDVENKPGKGAAFRIYLPYESIDADV